MREIEIGGKKFQVRSIRAEERTEHNLAKYGYGLFSYDTPKLAEGAVDEALWEEGFGVVMGALFSERELKELDLAGGLKGLRRAWLAVIAETYGGGDEEKNSSPAGSGSATPSGSDTAPSAASASAASAPPAAST